MTHSFRVHFFHLIWSTKGRKQLISEEIEPRLYSYMGGIIRNFNGQLLEIGGMPDHVHLLIELSNIDKFTHLIREVKASSSLWINQTFPTQKTFAWQEGYGSFSVSYSGLHKVRDYIRNQKRHHSKMSFDKEYLKFLKSHQINYDERFILG